MSSQKLHIRCCSHKGACCLAASSISGADFQLGCIAWVCSCARLPRLAHTAAVCPWSLLDTGVRHYIRPSRQRRRHCRGHQVDCSTVWRPHQSCFGSLCHIQHWLPNTHRQALADGRHCALPFCKEAIHCSWLLCLLAADNSQVTSLVNFVHISKVLDAACKFAVQLKAAIAYALV